MFLLIGVAAGALTGVPIGPVNVAVIDAAYRHTMRRAIAVALGGSLADGLYAALGMLGVTPILERYPSIPPILYAISGVILLVYGFFTARSQPVAPATDGTGSHAQIADPRKEFKEGFIVGLLLIILNPAAIVTWIVIMGTIIPQATFWGGIACAVGVTIGSFGWFALVAYLTQKGKSVLGEKAAWIPRLVGVALMVYSVYLLFKAVKFFVA
ncbi:MAG: LysE family translocator [Myxococcota bacterium]|nr:LysE family translocator [Myxococcota bacterium]